MRRITHHRDYLYFLTLYLLIDSPSLHRLRNFLHVLITFLVSIMWSLFSWNFAAILNKYTRKPADTHIILWYDVIFFSMSFFSFSDWKRKQTINIFHSDDSTLHRSDSDARSRLPPDGSIENNTKRNTPRSLWHQTNQRLLIRTSWFNSSFDLTDTLIGIFWHGDVIEFYLNLLWEY